MSVIVTERLRYPQSQLAPLEISKAWDERTRAIRSCCVCKRVYLHAGAAWVCERNPHPALTAP